MQVDPIKPTLKALGTKRLKPNYDEPPCNFAFTFILRRYSEVCEARAAAAKWEGECDTRRAELELMQEELEGCLVGRCRLIVSKS